MIRPKQAVGVAGGGAVLTILEPRIAEAVLPEVASDAANEEKAKADAWRRSQLLTGGILAAGGAAIYREGNNMRAGAGAYGLGRGIGLIAAAYMAKDAQAARAYDRIVEDRDERGGGSTT